MSNTSRDKIWRKYLPSKTCTEKQHKKQLSTTSATPATQCEGWCHQVSRLPHTVKVDVTKCHTCHAKWRSMSPSATPATQTAAATTASNDMEPKRHQSQPSAISATPATQSEGYCRQVPRLPHKVKVDVAKCNAKKAWKNVVMVFSSHFGWCWGLLIFGFNALYSSHTPFLIAPKNTPPILMW